METLGDARESRPLYRGRFAPSPTGPLHLGSLATAVASYLDARQHQGQWLVRIEDLDQPREVPQATEQILETLSVHGLESDEPILYQSQRADFYQSALTQLIEANWVFDCCCSRKSLKNHQQIHPAHCTASLMPNQPTAKRMRIPAHTTIAFDDRLQGHYAQPLDEVVGPFVLQRKDGIFAYQLAVVVDDAAQGITDVVRGVDIIDSTPRQLWLQQCLGFHIPHYLHLPLVCNDQNQKLSKQNHAVAVNNQTPIENLKHVFHLLGITLPELSINEGLQPAELLSIATTLWSPNKLPQDRYVGNFV